MGVIPVTFFQDCAAPDHTPELIQGRVHCSVLHIHQHPQNPGRGEGLAAGSTVCRQWCCRVIYSP